MTKCLKGCLLYLLVNLLSLPFLGCASRNEVSHLAFKPLFIEDKKMPIRDFTWAELRLGEVAGMEARYSTRVGKVISPLGEVAPKVDVAKYMKELRVPNGSFKPPATIADALLFLQNASIPYDGSGKVVLFALPPKKEGLKKIVGRRKTSNRRPGIALASVSMRQKKCDKENRVQYSIETRPAAAGERCR